MALGLLGGTSSEALRLLRPSTRTMVVQDHQALVPAAICGVTPPVAAARRGVCRTTAVVGVDDGVAGVADEGAREQQDRRCPLWLPSKKSEHRL